MYSVTIEGFNNTMYCLDSVIRPPSSILDKIININAISDHDRKINPGMFFQEGP